jgi:hypothetical protein
LVLIAAKFINLEFLNCNSFWAEEKKEVFQKKSKVSSVPKMSMKRS